MRIDGCYASPGSAENAILEGIRQGNLYVALIEEACVGFTYIIPKGAFHSFPYLHIIAVKEDYRDRGIGKALLDFSESIASKMADKLFLVVADYNPDAKRFYERNGYQQVGEISNLYRPGIAEYLMTKNSAIYPPKPRLQDIFGINWQPPITSAASCARPALPSLYRRSTFHPACSGSASISLWR